MVLYKGDVAAEPEGVGCSKRKRNTLENLLDRVKIELNGCWRLPHKDNGVGYIRISFQGERIYAHRYFYACAYGRIPGKLDCDHLCRNPFCCNPEHIEPVSHRENLNRGNHFHRRKTHCKHGHPFDEKNTYHRSDGKRACNICVNKRKREWRLRRKGCVFRRNDPPPID